VHFHLGNLYFCSLKYLQISAKAKKINVFLNMLTKECCATQSTKLLKTDCELSSSRALELSNSMMNSRPHQVSKRGRSLDIARSRSLDPKKPKRLACSSTACRQTRSSPLRDFSGRIWRLRAPNKFVMCQQIVDLRFKFADYSTVQNQFTRCSLLKMANAMYVFAIFGLELTDKLDGPKNLWVLKFDIP
jgi:hypothetical protein